MIEYNYLKLPRRIVKGGTIILYQYDASGKKLKETIGANVTDYVGNLIYKNNVLYQISHDEGRIINGEYEYNIKDHLGNLRVAFRDSLGIAKITQANSYGIWGEDLTTLSYLKSSWKGDNFKFTGKEELPETGYTDFRARLYDRLVPRFITIDPLAEKMRRWSPYNYGFDNPIRFIDPDGMQPGEYYSEKGEKIGDDGKKDNKVYVVKTTQTTNDIYPNVTNGVQVSNPITPSAATETESKIKEGNFTGNHMNNVVEIESKSNFSKMFDIVSKDDGGKGMKPENNTEYGGSISKDGLVNEATPGKTGDLSKDSKVSILIPTSTSTKSKFHSHPSGTFYHNSGDGIQVDKWVQPPSSGDISNSGTNNVNYVIGLRTNTIYIYNKSGVTATLPTSTFKKP